MQGQRLCWIPLKFITYITRGSKNLEIHYIFIFMITLNIPNCRGEKIIWFSFEIHCIFICMISLIIQNCRGKKNLLDREKYKMKTVWYVLYHQIFRTAGVRKISLRHREKIWRWKLSKSGIACNIDNHRAIMGDRTSCIAMQLWKTTIKDVFYLHYQHKH